MRGNIITVDNIKGDSRRRSGSLLSAQNHRSKVRNGNKSLQKIQPKIQRGERKIYRKNPFGSLLPKLAIGMAVLLGVYLIFFFEMPAFYPKSIEISKMTLDSAALTVKTNTSTYKGKLIPMDLLLVLGKGEIATVGENEKKLTFDGAEDVVIREGSRKVTIGGKTIKYDAPVMTVGDLTLIPGELMEDLIEDAAYKNGVLTYRLSDEAVAQKYETFTGNEGYLRLVNKENPLPPEFAPTDLVEMNSLKSITAYGSNTQLRKEAATALAKMYNENGVKYIMSSGYRDYATQTRLFEEKVANLKAMGYSEERARTDAATIVALPGTSEHQVGLAIDFSIPGVVLTESFKDTEAGQWLAANSYRYGFVLRYTEAQTLITKIIYEPWHFRYVGLPHSEIIHKEGIVFDTYIEELREEKLRYYKAQDGTQYIIWLLTGSLKPKSLEFNTDGGVGVSSDNKEGIILTLPLDQ